MSTSYVHHHSMSRIKHEIVCSLSLLAWDRRISAQVPYEYEYSPSCAWTRPGYSLVHDPTNIDRVVRSYRTVS